MVPTDKPDKLILFHQFLDGASHIYIQRLASIVDLSKEKGCHFFFRRASQLGGQRSYTFTFYFYVDRNILHGNAELPRFLDAAMMKIQLPRGTEDCLRSFCGAAAVGRGCIPRDGHDSKLRGLTGE